jgi:hypothetical protein
MTVLLVLIAAAALAAAVVLGVRARRQSRALGVAADRFAALQNDLDTARNDRVQQMLRADTAEAARDEAETRAAALDGELQVAASALAEAIRARDVAQLDIAELRDTLTTSADAHALWALEVARVERRWHLSVAPGIGLTSPLARCAPEDAPRVALDIIASALREETGTRFAIDWQLDLRLPPAAALLVVRTGEELLSAAALSSDRAELRVSQRDDHVLVGVDAVDDDQQPVALAPLELAGGLRAGPASATVGDDTTVAIPLVTTERDAA